MADGNEIEAERPKVVVVFSFDEPGNDERMKMPTIVEQAKQMFAEESGVKVHLANQDAAKYILSLLMPEDDGNFVRHAKRELDLFESDNDFKQALILAVRGFASYGHSGGSAEAGIMALHDLLQFKNLSPLTDDPKEWMRIHSGNDPACWQSTRNPEAFSLDGGKNYYLLSEGASLANPNPAHQTQAKE